MVAGHSIQVALCCTDSPAVAAPFLPTSFLDFGCMGFARFFIFFQGKLHGNWYRKVVQRR
jgi:hypothetical protein